MERIINKIEVRQDGFVKPTTMDKRLEIIKSEFERVRAEQFIFIGFGPENVSQTIYLSPNKLFGALDALRITRKKIIEKLLEQVSGDFKDEIKKALQENEFSSPQ